MERTINIEQFHRLADEYCIFVENHASFNRYDFLNKCLELFPRLYSAALTVPLPNGSDDTDLGERLTHAHLLYEMLGKYNFYSEVFDPIYPTDKDPSQAMLSEELDEIYWHLKKGLILWQQGRLVDAQWEWRFNFVVEWGPRLLSAQRAIHYLVFDHMGPSATA